MTREPPKVPGMRLAHARRIEPLPEVRPTLDWGRRPHQLAADPHMVRLTRGHWFRAPDHYDAVLRTVLLQKHFRRDLDHLMITGLPAMQLYNMPVGPTPYWINPALGDKAPPRHREVGSALNIPHFAWSSSRPRSGLEGAKLSKRHGVNGYHGPGDSSLVHPVEALVVAAPFLSSWRIIACLDYLLAHRIRVSEEILLRPFDRPEITRALALLPQRSRSVERVSRLLARSVERTWSATETLTRLLVLKNGFPPPTMNPLVFLDGAERFPDVAWPEKRTALKYNGTGHALDIRSYRDENYRLERFRDAGWNVRVLVWEDLKQSHRRAQWMQWLSLHLA